MLAGVAGSEDQELPGKVGGLVLAIAAGLPDEGLYIQFLALERVQAISGL